MEQSAALCYTENTPNIGRNTPLAALVHAWRVCHNKYIHIAARRVLARASEGSLMLILRREIRRDAHLRGQKCSIRQVPVVRSPPVNPVVRGPIGEELFQVRHKLAPRALHRDELIPK
eukprot:scaffold14833_cov125-Isochrysis_galbana.AAC.3